MHVGACARARVCVCVRAVCVCVCVRSVCVCGVLAVRVCVRARVHLRALVCGVGSRASSARVSRQSADAVVESSVCSGCVQNHNTL